MASSAQPGSDLGILVLLAYQGFVRRLHEDMAEHGHAELGRSDGLVFRMLAGGGRTVSELAVRLEITKQGAAQIIEDMERRGYVVRRPDPSDGRARLVELDERGRDALAVARAFHRAYEQRLVAEHGARTIAAFRSVLESMAAQAPEGLDRELRAVYL